MLAYVSQPDPVATKLVQNQRQIDALQLEQSRLAYELSQGTVWREAGFHSAVDWIRFNCHLTAAVAAGYLRGGARGPSQGVDPGHG